MLPVVLFVLGLGFLVANLLLFVDLIRYFLRRRRAPLTWRGPAPRFYGVLLALGVALGALVFLKVVLLLRRPPPRLITRADVYALFGETMMFLYYGFGVPLSRWIGRGFYEDGIWSERGFMPYWQIGGISWRDGPPITLILISRMRNLARHLIVPATHYAAVRRLLRDKIAAHDIDFTGTGLNLGIHDERDDV